MAKNEIRTALNLLDLAYTLEIQSEEAVLLNKKVYIEAKKILEIAADRLDTLYLKLTRETIDA